MGVWLKRSVKVKARPRVPRRALQQKDCLPIDIAPLRVRGVDGPALVSLVEQHIVDVIFDLRMVGEGLAELVRHAVGLEGQAAEHEVAVARPARSLLRQARMRQRLEAHRRDRPRLRGDQLHDIGVRFTHLAGRENGAIVETAQRAPVRK